jgi:hypothetical protein
MDPELQQMEAPTLAPENTAPAAEPNRLAA